jgi:CubicO group peptidase (beta-lactamase class C family)
MRHTLTTPPAIEGFVAKGFEGVRDAFAENFARRGELGAACCVYQDGVPVVDLWGGVRDKASGAPWESDTMVLVYSATKGLSALAMALAASRGLFDYDERVCAYWPEFAQAGKGEITVRQLLAHQAGLFAFDEPVGRADVEDLDRLAGIMARQTPAWPPGERYAYHAISLGFYESELLRRVDPEHRSIGRYFADEIAGPLGLEFYIRLPEDIPTARLAPLERPGLLRMLTGMPVPLMLGAMNPRSALHRALVVNPGSELPIERDKVYARDLEVPSGGGVGTARAMAKAYGVFAAGGRELGLRPQTLADLAAPAIPPRHGPMDECLKGEVAFSLGFMKPTSGWPFGHPGSYGAPGAGGSLGYADPEAGIGYGYVTNQMGTNLAGDARDVALRRALPERLRAAA